MVSVILVKSLENIFKFTIYFKHSTSISTFKNSYKIKRRLLLKNIKEFFMLTVTVIILIQQKYFPSVF